MHLGNVSISGAAAVTSLHRKVQNKECTCHEGLMWQSDLVCLSAMRLLSW